MLQTIFRLPLPPGISPPCWRCHGSPTMDQRISSQRPRWRACPRSHPRRPSFFHPALDILCQQVSAEQRVLFFKVRNANPGRRAVVQLAPTSGRRLGQGDLTATVHRCIEFSEDAAVIDSRPVQTSSSVADVVVMSSLEGDASTLQAETTTWTTSTSGLMFAGEESHDFRFAS